MAKMKLKILDRMIKDDSPRFIKAAKVLYEGFNDVEKISREDLIRLTLILIYSHGFMTGQCISALTKSLLEDLEGEK